MNKDIKVDGKPNKYGEATRHTKENKGRFDLIPGDVINALIKLTEEIFRTKESYSVTPLTIMKTVNDEAYLSTILLMMAYNSKMNLEGFTFGERVTFTCSDVTTELYVMLSDLAIHFQKGAEIYGERNCEKGIPLWSFRDSGIRHLIQWFKGFDDEPHYISAIWNFVMALWTIRNHPERCGEIRFQPDYDGDCLNTFDIPHICNNLFDRVYEEIEKECGETKDKCKGCKCDHPCEETGKCECTEEPDTDEESDDDGTCDSEYEYLRKFTNRLKALIESRGDKVDGVKAYTFDPENCKTEDITEKLFGDKSKSDKPTENENKYSSPGNTGENIADPSKDSAGDIVINKIIHGISTRQSKEDIFKSITDILDKIL